MRAFTSLRVFALQVLTCVVRCGAPHVNCVSAAGAGRINCVDIPVKHAPIDPDGIQALDDVLLVVYDLPVAIGCNAADGHQEQSFGLRDVVRWLLERHKPLLVFDPVVIESGFTEPVVFLYLGDQGVGVEPERLGESFDGVGLIETIAVVCGN